MTVRATIPAAFLLSWESQACQYPEGHTPGLFHYLGDLDSGDLLAPTTTPLPAYYVDCLLFYGPDRRLWGILNHYTVADEYEKPGNVNLWVNPRHQRQGVGRRLLTAAIERWPIDPAQQRYTDAGLAFARTVWPELGGEPAILMEGRTPVTQGGTQ